jgi:hypothetical protein
MQQNLSMDSSPQKGNLRERERERVRERESERERE